MSTLKERLALAMAGPPKVSQAALARACGISAPSVNDWVSGKTKTIEGENLLLAAELLKVAPMWLATGKGRMRKMGAEEASPGQMETNVEPGPPIYTAARRINIMGTAQMGPDGHWVGLEDAGGFVETWSRDADAYALLLRGDSMAPAIRSGWVALCEPNHRLVPGEYVMVTTNDDQSMVKELLFQNDEGVSLMSINSAYERVTIPWTQIQTIHYVGAILGPSKVLGRI
ncbi:phage repressor protein [Pseudomonas syringae group genomosp. 3]|uniref:Phage repressor protein n=1 Tax=Pseudomonas syringae group genomosp. 3 TaxID=251701 RepID=A0A2K4WJF8_9PSED|nr:LexA family transcriptional regulator [Pseudomonas syringae group genomosp. 3]SOS36021.1 phage repressor protein [Pseudomonas syringae group genomosp. 3]